MLSLAIMSPTNEQVIEQFNEYINMTKEELTEWLGKGDSQDAGWTGGSGEGETVGHERCVLAHRCRRRLTREAVAARLSASSSTTRARIRPSTAKAISST